LHKSIIAAVVLGLTTICSASSTPTLTYAVEARERATVLAFAFQAKHGNSAPVLSDAEARKLATKTAEPEFILTKKPPAGTQFTVRVSVDEEGKVIGLKNINNLDMGLVGAANGALHKWAFRPYLYNGKPEGFDADITFRVQ
jgi:hypothetical protein